MGHNLLSRTFLIYLIIFTASVLILGSNTAFATCEKVRHFVVDLDETLIVKLTTDEVSPTEMTPGYIKISDGVYHVVPLASEFIAVLSLIPNAHISFFSGGDEKRNTEALDALKLPSGKSMLSVAHSVLSFKDLVLIRNQNNFEVHQPDNHFFSGRRKKNLLLVPGINLDEAALIDDNPAYVAKGQERNWASVERKPKFTTDFEKFYLDRTRGKRPIAVATQHARGELRGANRLVRILGIILEAIEVAEAKNTPFSDELEHLQMKNGKFHFNFSSDQKFFVRGISAMKTFNSKAQIISMGPSCPIVMSWLINPWNN